MRSKPQKIHLKLNSPAADSSEKIDKTEEAGTMSPNKYQTPQILTIQEVADLLRVHRSTISRFAKSGELKSYLIGDRRLFRDCDVWVFFENQMAHECVFGKEAK